MKYVHNATGATIYAVVRSEAGTVWNGSALEARTVANWATYDVAMPETPAGGFYYVGTFPATAAEGWYAIDVYVQAGAGPAISDTPVATISGYWTGSVWVDDGLKALTGTV